MALSSRFLALCSATSLAFVPLGAAWAQGVAAREAPAAHEDQLATMFRWWNEAMKTPGALTQANFARFFTPDATLTLNGVEVIQGLDDWVSHFTKIQASGARVEIVVPFKASFREGDRLYTYHVIRSRRDGAVSCMLAAGHATLREGKIAAIVLLRAPLDMTAGPVDPACWTH
ncbi:hypothetical protein [Novosphingobium profundi]|uniref:hypothetical protein n=1 Tax=Novosphingobium profundi TaxID=1774954 RepID=UPI001FE756CC|nr:hypothetical protein [Novosphingobium profundi]